MKFWILVVWLGSYIDGGPAMLRFDDLGECEAAKEAFAAEYLPNRDSAWNADAYRYEFAKCVEVVK